MIEKGLEEGAGGRPENSHPGLDRTENSDQKETQEAPDMWPFVK